MTVRQRASAARSAAVEAGHHRPLQPDHGLEQAAVELRACFGQLEHAHAPIGGVEPAAHEAGGLEPVDMVGDRGALEVDVGRERRLACTQPRSESALSTIQLPSDPPAAASASSNAARIAFAVKTSWRPRLDAWKHRRRGAAELSRRDSLHHSR